jgi:hypothetical protein
MPLIAFVLIVGTVIIITIATTIRASSASFLRLVKREVSGLAIRSEAAGSEQITDHLICRLPEPVQRYFHYIMPEGCMMIRFARIKQTGLFRTDPSRNWMPVCAYQYFSAKFPGFIWHARVFPLPPLWIEARDRYDRGLGNMLVRLLSTISIVDAKGPEIDVSSLLRYLGEMPWFPTAFLNEEFISWEPIDSSHARAVITDGNLSASGVFTFDDEGRIVTFTTRGRYRTVGDKFVGDDFTGIYSEYRQRNGFRIPMNIEAVWNLSKGDFPYAQLRIAEIEYDAFSGF